MGDPTKTPQRKDSPLNPKAPRIYVLESNGAVESQVRAAGGVCVRPSYTPEQCIRDLASCDGLLITGGGDVNPAVYGQGKHDSVYGLSTARDIRELSLLGAARDLGMPVLGICRGLQVINVEAGGTLYQNVPDKVNHQDHSWSMMPVTTVPGSQVHRALGQNPVMLHLHHQSVRRLAKGFQVTARHADGIVEAIESVDGRVVGVQFHPESVLTSASAAGDGWRMFDLFIGACTRFRRRMVTVGRTPIQNVDKYVNAWPVALDAHEASRSRAYVGYEGTYVGSKVVGGGDSTPKGTGGDRSAANGSKSVTSGTRLTLLDGGKDSQISDQGIVGWCGNCGVAFDDEQDWFDHTEWFLCGGQRFSFDERHPIV